MHQIFKIQKIRNMCARRYPAGAGLLRKHTQQQHHTNGGVEASKWQWCGVNDRHISNLPLSTTQYKHAGVHDRPCTTAGSNATGGNQNSKRGVESRPKTPKKRTCQKAYKEEDHKMERTWSG